MVSGQCWIRLAGDSNRWPRARILAASRTRRRCRLRPASYHRVARRSATGEIAERVGYSSQDALSRVFKRVVGTSMGAYRSALVRDRNHSSY
ncbi:MAG: AraC family transcriptional regulator [Proteobacteria bacterium]|nr:AraC family transcriptional regulator [Pseudomonadota bacterium]